MGEHHDAPVGDGEMLGTVTRLLQKMSQGDAGAQEELFRRVFDELRRMARGVVGGSRRLADIDATELVGAAFVRLVDRASLERLENRRHFFFVYGRAMRDALADAVKAAAAKRRGGGWTRRPLIDIAVDGESLRVDAVAIREALQALEATDALGAQVATLVLFGGRSQAEVAELLERSEGEIRSNWLYARAWLRDRMAGRGIGKG